MRKVLFGTAALMVLAVAACGKPFAPPTASPMPEATRSPTPVPTPIRTPSATDVTVPPLSASPAQLQEEPSDFST